MPTKRKALPQKVLAMKSRKRQKLDAGAVDRPTKNRKVKVSVDALPWKQIAHPDQLGDYEGLSGFLEEIDDVEVVRDEAGKISYRYASDQQEGNVKQSSTSLPSEASEDDDEQSWSGFEDDAPVSTNSTSTLGSAHADTKKVTKGRHNGPSPVEHELRADARLALHALEDTEAENVDVTAWSSLQLSPDTMASLRKLRFTKPSAIQSAVIPLALKGHDVIGKAPTGSGKTLAFGIPILERLLERAHEGHKASQTSPLALLLSPTRELAHQLETHLSTLFKGAGRTSARIATLTGGLSVQKQQRLLNEAQIVIGTPGRLWEVMSAGTGVIAALQQIEFLIIDEADRLLSQGHYQEVEHVLNALDRTHHDEEEDHSVKHDTVPGLRRQTLVFSATFDRSLQDKLAGKAKRKDNLLGSKETLEYLLSKLNFREEAPAFVDVNPVHQLAVGLKEGLVECGGTEKDLYLYALLLLKQASRTIVFTNSITAVRRITPLLRNLDLNALPLHSGMPQKARLRSVEQFTQGKGSGDSSSSILIATDVAARGLDIPHVDFVVHYHLPRAADMYVHRSGRTARAGQQGSSVLICAPEEVAGVRRLIARVHAQSVGAPDVDASHAAKQGFYIRNINIDRRVVARLKERATLAKKLADASIAKEKQHKEDSFMRSAAEELGVEYDSEDFEKQAIGKHGRGAGRRKKEREIRALSKAEIGAIRMELKHLLRERVNVGVSERYPTSGRIDVDELLRQKQNGNAKTGDFLGLIDDTGLEDL